MLIILIFFWLLISGLLLAVPTILQPVCSTNNLPNLPSAAEHFPQGADSNCPWTFCKSGSPFMCFSLCNIATGIQNHTQSFVHQNTNDTSYSNI